MADLDLNINGDARRARAALNDVATGSARAARITDQLSRSFDHLENEANDAQRALDRVQDEINDTGPTAELNAELARLQHRLSEISDERRVTENMRAEFRRATASAATLDHELAAVRRELDRLNDEYSQGGDPNVLRRIQEQQRELQRLNGIRRRIASEDEENQHRLGRLAEEARRAQLRREEEDRRRSEDEDNRWIRRMRRRVSNLGDNAGNGLQGAPVPPTFLAAGAAIGSAAAVPLLAAIGGALTGIAGAGVAGAGIAGAIMGDPEKFKSAWGNATDSIKTDFLDVTKIFTGPTLDAIETIGPLVDSWNLDETFGNAAKFVKPLVSGVEGFATGIVRGVSAMVDKGEPAVLALSAGLSELGDAAGDAFEDIADGAEGGGEALRDVLFFTADLIRGFGEITQAAEDAYGYIHDHPIESALMSGGLSLPISLMDQFSDETDQAAVALDDVTLAAGGAARSGEDLADAWVDAETAMKKSAETADRLFDAQMHLAGADIAWEQAVDDLTDSIKENGDSWDITTQKGRDNTEQLITAIQAAKDHRDAMIANGESTATANQRYQDQIAYLQSVALKAGLTKERFDAMTAALLNYINAPMNKTIVTKFLDIHYVSSEGRIGDGTDPRNRPGSAYAAGGSVSETGWALVGEQGPEIRWLNKGDEIWDAQKTARALTSGMGPMTMGGGGQISATLAVVGNGNPLSGLIQQMVDAGQLQLFVNGQPVTVR